MANLYLLKYNNLYNRIVKKPYTLLADYLDNHEYEAFFGLDFNPNDGLTSTQIFNTRFPAFMPNYLIVENSETFSFTRWFVIETVRTRAGQYRVSLKRDILSDFYDETLNSICFINKGFVGAENPLIFNSENVLVNQIKRTEIPLRDKTRAAWVIGYLAPNLAAEGDVAVNVSFEQEGIADISEFEFSEYVGKELKGLVNKEKSYFGVWSVNGRGGAIRFFNNTGEVKEDTFFVGYPINTITVKNKDRNQLANLDLNINYTVFNTVLTNHIGNEDYDDILKLKDRVYNDNGTYKKVVITPVEDETYLDFNAYASSQPNIVQEVVNGLTAQGCEVDTPFTGNIAVPMRIFYSSFKLTLEEVGSPITNANVTFKSTIKRLKDAPYKMFCMPIADNAVLKVGSTVINTNKEKVLQMASAIATGLKTSTDGFLYDMQLLPYCPIADKFEITTDVNGIEYVGEGTEHIDFDIIKDSEDNAVGYIFYSDKSSFTTNIYGISSSLLPTMSVNDPIEFKAKNETHMFRIVAPNFANFDDFNLFMNYGIDYVNVDCTYKPLTPYVKLNINYKGLYGKDFNDQRGLIFNGDYSLPVISDNWINYQIQNKNWSNAFERETQHLEYMHKWKMASTITGAAVGTAAGGLIGSKLGSAAGGAIAGGIGGALDIFGTAATYAEQMDYRRDSFNFNIQNIQALPRGLVKTSQFNYNSRLHPYIEVYSATDTELEMVKNKIKYSGMTLNTIGSPKDYLNPSDMTYIQGRVIKIDIDEDTHIANAINSELNMGVYYE